MRELDRAVADSSAASTAATVRDRRRRRFGSAASGTRSAPARRRASGGLRTERPSGHQLAQVRDQHRKRGRRDHEDAEEPDDRAAAARRARRRRRVPAARRSGDRTPHRRRRARPRWSASPRTGRTCRARRPPARRCPTTVRPRACGSGAWRSMCAAAPTSSSGRTIAPLPISARMPVASPCPIGPAAWNQTAIAGDQTQGEDGERAAVAAVLGLEVAGGRRVAAGGAGHAADDRGQRRATGRAAAGPGR